MILYGPTFHVTTVDYVLYSNITYIYPVSYLVERKLFQFFFQNCFKIVSGIPPAVIVWGEYLPGNNHCPMFDNDLL